MLSSLLIDKVQVILVTADQNGVQVTSAQTPTRARVSEKNKLVMDSKGQEVVSSMHVILPQGSTVTYMSRIKILELHGVPYVLPLKEWKIIRISRGHAFKRGFIELWVGAASGVA